MHADKCATLITRLILYFHHHQNKPTFILLCNTKTHENVNLTSVDLLILNI
jgi:hypothetical protein